MSELHVRQVPPELDRQLRARARADGRSLSAEVIALLRAALQPADDRAARHRAAADRLAQIRHRNRLPADEAPAEDLVRADRDAR